MIDNRRGGQAKTDAAHRGVQRRVTSTVGESGCQGALLQETGDRGGCHGTLSNDKQRNPYLRLLHVVIATQANDLHAIKQGTRDGIQHVSSAHKEHLDTKWWGEWG